MELTRFNRCMVLAASALLGLGGCGLLDDSSSRRRDDDVSRRRSEPRSSDRYDTDRYDSDRYDADRYDSDRTRDRYDDRSSDRYDDSRTGSTTSGDSWYDDRRYDDEKAYERDTRSRDPRETADVPRAPREAAVGKGTVSYRATQDGRIWVTDTEFDKVLWSGKVYDGEVVEVVPKRGRVFVDRREVLKTNLNNDIRYRIYFDRDRY